MAKSHHNTTDNVTNEKRQIELTDESGLGGAKHGDGTVFVVVSLSSPSSRQAGWHVKVGANVSAYATAEDSLTGAMEMREL